MSSPHPYGLCCAFCLAAIDFELCRAQCRRMPLPPLSVLGLIAVLAMPSMALAQPYRWVDADGVVNYGDSPPAGAKDLRKIQGNVSVIPGIPKEQMDQLRERDAQRRQQRLAEEAKPAPTASSSTGVVDELAYFPDYYYPPRRRVPPGTIDKVRPDRPNRPADRPVPTPLPEPVLPRR